VDTADILGWNVRNTVYLIFILGVVMIVWEATHRVINFYRRKFPHDIIQPSRLAQLFVVITLITIPLVAGASYFSTYYIKSWLNCPVGDLQAEFWRDTIQSQLITWLIVSGQIIKVYFEYNRQAETEKALIQKELLLSKYESLKDQLNPHFLFNNFSVLTSLIHKNPDLASDFLAKLSKMYRYILDNKENQMSSLEKEFQFLDAYIFLLKTRHEESIMVQTEVDLEKSDFYVPTLSLQMLIENAIKHNSFSAHQPLEIKIFNEGTDYLVVRNRVRAKSGGSIQSTKIGLENIRQRYSLQSEKQVVVNHKESFFTVKLPILNTLQLT